MLYSHVVVRLASQTTGLAFGIRGYRQVGLIIAYLVLGAEGYFTLVLCTGRFLVSWHNKNFGDSWLERKRDPDQQARMTLWQKILANFSLSEVKQRPLPIIHWVSEMFPFLVSRLTTDVEETLKKIVVNQLAPLF